MARVLIVDDDYDTAFSYAILLREWGHETRRAYDGESVLQQALAFHPHAILLDIGLPKIDGYEVARRLRRYQHLVAVKIAAVTGRDTDADEQKWKDAGFDEFFTKPMVPERMKVFLASIG
jgi:DNA-binding response OmpR family regulator